MLLIAAALMEELNVALNLCTKRTRVAAAGVRLWSAVHQDFTIHFLKTGAGPRRSGTALEIALRSLQFGNILVIGYAGALSRGMKLGNLAVLRRAALFGGGGKVHTSFEETSLTDSLDLVESPRLFAIAQTTGTPVHLCDGLTSAHIIGDPSQKRFLHERFGVSVVDMETATLARVAASAGIPLGCVRAVSDETDDTFLAPFTYDPSATLLKRAARVLSAGNWVRRYGEWRDRSAIARESLRRFLSAYLSQDSALHNQSWDRLRTDDGSRQ
jgi:nucleoside phosphorylase